MHDPLVLAWAIHRPPITPKEFGRLRREWQRLRRTRSRWKALRSIPSFCPGLVDIWHREPGGADSLTRCRGKHPRRRLWRFHVHHWHLRVWPAFNMRRFLTVRCTVCGQRFPYGYAPIKSANGLNHHECSSLATFRWNHEHVDGRTIRLLTDRVVYETGVSVEVLIEYVGRELPPDPIWAAQYRRRQRLADVNGLQREGDDYPQRWVPKPAEVNPESVML